MKADAAVIAETIQRLGAVALGLIVGNWELGSSHHHSSGGAVYQASTLRGQHIGSIHFKRDEDSAVVRFLDAPSRQVPRGKALETFRSSLQAAGYVWLESIPLLAPWGETTDGVFERCLLGGAGISIQVLPSRNHRFMFPFTVVKATTRASAFPGRIDPYLDPLPLHVDLAIEGVEDSLAKVDLWLEREGVLLEASTAKEPLNLNPFRPG